MYELDERGFVPCLDEVIEAASEWDHVFFSVDIDSLDPAFAPGTGTPEIGGLTTRELGTRSAGCPPSCPSSGSSWSRSRRRTTRRHHRGERPPAGAEASRVWVCARADGRGPQLGLQIAKKSSPFGNHLLTSRVQDAEDIHARHGHRHSHLASPDVSWMRHLEATRHLTEEDHVQSETEAWEQLQTALANLERPAALLAS